MARIRLMLSVAFIAAMALAVLVLVGWPFAFDAPPGTALHDAVSALVTGMGAIGLVGVVVGIALWDGRVVWPATLTFAFCVCWTVLFGLSGTRDVKKVHPNARPYAHMQEPAPRSDLGD